MRLGSATESQNLANALWDLLLVYAATMHIPKPPDSDGFLSITAPHAHTQATHNTSRRGVTISVTAPRPSLVAIGPADNPNARPGPTDNPIALSNIPPRIDIGHLSDKDSLRKEVGRAPDLTDAWTDPWPQLSGEHQKAEPAPGAPRSRVPARQRRRKSASTHRRREFSGGFPTDITKH